MTFTLRYTINGGRFRKAFKDPRAALFRAAYLRSEGINVTINGHPTRDMMAIVAVTNYARTLAAA